MHPRRDLSVSDNGVLAGIVSDTFSNASRSGASSLLCVPYRRAADLKQVRAGKESNLPVRKC
jgi:hypothetical protein